jgi:hypothetical protein
VDWLVTLVFFLVSDASFCSLVFSPSIIRAGVFVCFLLVLIRVTKSVFMVPVVEHRDIGLESLPRRLSGSSFSSRDCFGKFIDGVSFTYISGSVLIDDIEALGCDRDRGVTNLFGLSHSFVFVIMSHGWGVNDNLIVERGPEIHTASDEAEKGPVYRLLPGKLRGQGREGARSP